MGTTNEDVFQTEENIRPRRKVFDLGVNDLSYMLNQTNSRVCVWDYRGEVVIDGILNADINITGSSDWSSKGGLPGGIGKFVDSTIDAAREVSAYGEMMGLGGGMQSIKVTSPVATAVDWKGSGDFTLAFTITLVCLSADHDIRKDIRNMTRGVFPSINWVGTKITAPMGYRKQARQKLSRGDSLLDVGFREKLSGTPGCWGIAVGDWFETEPLFVMETANAMVSKEQTIYGAPLYANVVLNMRCSQIVSWDMIERWLKQDVIQDV